MTFFNGFIVPVPQNYDVTSHWCMKRDDIVRKVFYLEVKLNKLVIKS